MFCISCCVAQSGSWQDWRFMFLMLFETWDGRVLIIRLVSAQVRVMCCRTSFANWRRFRRTQFLLVSHFCGLLFAEYVQSSHSVLLPEYMIQVSFCWNRETACSQPCSKHSVKHSSLWTTLYAYTLLLWYATMQLWTPCGKNEHVNIRRENLF
jgi:hypothetical protein